MARRALIFTIAIICVCSLAWGQQDIIITGQSAYTVLGRGLQWGSVAGAQPAMNNNFVFQALNPNTTVCVYVTNNNPTNAHNITIALQQAGDPQVKTFQIQQAKWAAAQTVQVFPITVNPLTTQGFFFNVSAAALLAAQITGTITAAGTPDTADVFAVQTTSGGCGITKGTPIPVTGALPYNTSILPSNQVPLLIGGMTQPGVTSSLIPFAVGLSGGSLADGGTPPVGQGFLNPSTNFYTPRCTSGGLNKSCLFSIFSGTTFGNNSGGYLGGGVKTNLLEMADDLAEGANVTVGFNALGTLTNPGAGATLLHQFNQNNGTKSSAYKYLVLSCSAACELQVIRTTTQGTTCTAIVLQNLNLWTGARQAPAATDVAENNCTTAPTQSGILYDLLIGANAPYTLDLAGVVNASSTTGAGIMVKVVGAVTGVTSATLSYSEQ